MPNNHFPSVYINFSVWRDGVELPRLRKTFDYSLPGDRRELGEACRMAFIAGNEVRTAPSKP